MAGSVRIRLRSHNRVKKEDKPSDAAVMQTQTQRKTLSWRDKLRLKPEVYANFLRKDALRQKVHRASLTKEEKLYLSEGSRLRMIRYRQRLKKRVEDNPALRKVKTELTEEMKAKLRAKWREAKKKQRESKMKKNEKCREACHQTKMNQDINKSSQQQLGSTHKSPESSSVAKARTSQPKTQEQSATSVKSPVQTRSPQQQPATKHPTVTRVTRAKGSGRIIDPDKTTLRTVRSKSGPKSKTKKSVTAATSGLKKCEIFNGAGKAVTRQNDPADKTRNAAVVKDEANLLPVQILPERRIETDDAAAHTSRASVSVQCSPNVTDASTQTDQLEPQHNAESQRWPVIESYFSCKREIKREDDRSCSNNSLFDCKFTERTVSQ